MKTPRKLAALTLLLILLNLPFANAHAQGSLTPPGAPAATMKTLDQLEPRTPIASLPYTISTPGSYYLTTNLTTTVSNAIIIAASGVTLDLKGFTIYSTVANAANGGYAIMLAGGVSDVTISHGHIVGGVTNNVSGSYTGSGFTFGIHYSVAQPVNVHVSDVSVAKCALYGIYLGMGSASMVESCSVRTVGDFGIVAGVVKTCEAMDCAGTAISGDEVSDARGESTGSGTGVYGTTAQNCYGSSKSGSGLNAVSAMNCYGYTAGGGYGISADYTAENCSGTSAGGIGLHARVANNCIGLRSGGTAIQATIATACLAVIGTNSITYKYNMP